MIAPTIVRAYEAEASLAGSTLDRAAPWAGCMARVDKGSAEAPADRAAVTVPFWTGVRAIDGLLTLGRGARIGLFGAPGAGKTT